MKPPSGTRREAIAAAIEWLYHRPSWSKDGIIDAAERVAAEWESEKISALRAGLVAAREELDRHGHGDMHYGAMPRDPRVLAALAEIDRLLE